MIQATTATGEVPSPRPPNLRAGPATVQRVELVKAGTKGYRLATRDDHRSTVVNTTILTPEERNALVLDLTREGKGDLLAQIRKEWGEVSLAEIGDLGELLALNEQIAALKAKDKRFDEGDQKTVAEISERLAKAQSFLSGAARDSSLQLYQDVVRDLVRELNAALGQELEANAPAELNLAVGAPEIADYRADVARMGTWGGWAEAEALAQQLFMQVPIFIIAGGAFHLVTTVGRNHPLVGQWAAVHLGNHYEVVQGVQEGTLVGAENEWLETAKSGDCLFESMILIRNNGIRLPRPELTLTFIRQLRGQVAARLTDAAIEESIQEALVFGDVASVGPKTRALVHARRRTAQDVSEGTEESLTARIEGLKELADFDSFDFAGQLKAYLAERASDPKSDKTVQALSVLNGDLERAEFALGKQRGDFDFASGGSAEASEEASPLDRPKDVKARAKIEADARAATLARSDLEIADSPNNVNQRIVTQASQEYVLDKIGQLVPRYTRRNISQVQRAELHGTASYGKEKREGRLNQGSGFYPSNLSPFKSGRAGSVASGTGGNKIKNESPEMHHVQGHKPSDFLSVTASSADALNPKGKTFDAAATAVIDLSHLDPAQISALYTSAGMRYYLLDAFGGDKAGAITEASAEQAKKNPSSEGLAKRQAILSVKEWQALLDVIRTMEVLISGFIPKAAINELGSDKGSGRSSDKKKQS